MEGQERWRWRRRPGKGGGEEQEETRAVEIGEPIGRCQKADTLQGPSR